MATTKIAISIDEQTLSKLDELVRDRKYPSRSRAIQLAVEEKLNRLAGTRLAEESAKLDPKEEQAFAEEGISDAFSQWPEY